MPQSRAPIGAIVALTAAAILMSFVTFEMYRTRQSDLRFLATISGDPSEALSIPAILAMCGVSLVLWVCAIGVGISVRRARQRALVQRPLPDPRAIRYGTER